MLFRKIENWTDPEELKGLLFFAQRMEELTFEYSLDSFRSPTTNVPYLLQEILSALQAHLDIGLPISSVHHILDETETRLHGNKIANELLSVRLENYLNFDRNNTDAMKSALTVMSKELAPRLYILKCFELLKGAVSQNKKGDIEFLSREAVTTLLNMGFSGFFINQAVREFFFINEPVTSSDDLDRFLKLIFPEVHTFEIILKIRSPVGILKKEILDIFHLSFAAKIPKRFLDECSAEFKTLENGEKYLVVEKLKAFDGYSALDQAKNRIARVHDLYGLYYHKGSYSYGDSAEVKQKCCSEKKYTVKLQINRMHFVDDNKPRDAAQKLDTMFRTLNIPRGDDRDKFFRVIDFHGISSKSETVENQLINLWTSLETLVPARSEGSIISGVTRGVLPFIGLNYVRRIFERLTFDIVRWNRRELTKILKEAKYPENSDLVEKIFCLVTNDENEPHLSQFLGQMGNFELLKFRIYSLNRQYSKPKSVRQVLDKHQRRVEWQLHRIYRTRNAIVHSGITPNYTPLLVANAHDYFDQVFSMAVQFGSRPGGFYTFSECFDYAERLYKQYYCDLQNLDAIDSKSVAKIIWRQKNKPSKADVFIDAE